MAYADSDQQDLDFPLPKGFVALGYDVMWNIAQYCLDIKSIVRLSSTCKTLKYQVLDDDENVWAPIALSRGIVARRHLDERRTKADLSSDFAPWRSLVRRALSDAKYHLVNEILTEGQAYQTNPDQYAGPVWDAAEGKASNEFRTSLRRLGTMDFTGGLSIGKAGLWPLASALRHASTLDTLRLRGQLIRNHGAQLLSLAATTPKTDAVPSGPNSYDKRLKAALASSHSTAPILEKCFPGPSNFRGFSLCGFGLSVSIISLDGNKIEGEEGGMAIAALIANCPQLSMLNLSKNAIDKVGAQAIAKSIESHGNMLSRFYIDENPITDKGAEQLIAAFAAQFVKRARGPSGPNIRWLQSTPFAISMESCKLTAVPQAARTLHQSLIDLSVAIESKLGRLAAEPSTNGSKKETKRSERCREVWVLLGNPKSSKADRNSIRPEDKVSATLMTALKVDQQPALMRLLIDLQTVDANENAKDDKGGCMCM